MTVTIPVGFAQAAWIFGSTRGTPPLVTTLGLDIGDVGGAFTEAANRCFEVWVDNFGGFLNENLSLDRVQLTIGVDGPGGSVDSSVPAYQGILTNGAEAVGMAACMVKATAVLGRRGRGKMLMPGVLNDTDVGFSGEIDDDKLEELYNAFNGFLNDLKDTEGPGPIMIPNLLHSDATGMAPSPIIGGGIRPKVAWVRGRLH